MVYFAPMRVFLLILLLLCSGLLIAQNGKYGLGARNAALGGATTAIGDQWAVFNNPGALGLVEDAFAFTTYQNRYNLASFKTVGAGYVQPLKAGTAGIGFYSFGDEFFSEQRVNVAFGHKLDRVSLGASADYLQYNIATVGSRGIFVFEFGGVAELTKTLSFGAHIFNVNQARLVQETDEFLPTVMKAGLLYKPTDELILHVETEKDLDFKEVFRAGIEYRIIEKVFLRTGFSTQPFNGAGGVGFHPRNWQFDYAFSNDTNLGSIHEISVSYLMRKK
jgi:hypothetical protein